MRRMALTWGMLASMVQVGNAWAADCGHIGLQFFDEVRESKLFIEPGEPTTEVVARTLARLDLEPVGTRIVRSRFWPTTYRVELASSDLAAETYWAEDVVRPVFVIDFQRDDHGRIARESVRRGDLRGLVAWYEYQRDESGRLRQLVYRISSDAAGLPSDDDPGVSRVELAYVSTATVPSGATIFYATGARVGIQFNYDAGGLIGGTRDGGWPARFSITEGACREVPERLFVLLLSSHGGPWHPYTRVRRGSAPADPR